MGRSIHLHPNEMALGATLEYMALPPDLGAQVVTRSSYGRLGLITATAVQVHPYFHGYSQECQLVQSSAMRRPIQQRPRRDQEVGPGYTIESANRLIELNFLSAKPM
jgi:deoxycytidine triphosphate deaminase